MRTNFRRVPVPPEARQSAGSKTFPAPTRGLILNENLVLSQPIGAQVLDNWMPTQKGIRMRAGLGRIATIGDIAVQSLFGYSVAGTAKLFATDQTSIFDVSSVSDPTEPPEPVVTDQTAGYYSTALMTNADGDSFLYAVNGADDALLYDGADWQKMNADSTPALTGASGLSSVWKHRSRLFFTNGTMTAYYLATNAIAGALTALPMASLFNGGGFLLFGATWSTDAGDGMDDRCIFVTSEGEIAVFAGSNPSDGNNWQLIGRYDIARPMGKNARMSVGGDLLLNTADGVVPMSAVLMKQPDELSLAAVSRAIEPAWKQEASVRAAVPWEVAKWTEKGMGIFTCPASGNQQRFCFIVNLETRAWTRFTGWDAQCVATFQGGAYIGTSDGRVLQCEVGGSDDGDAYVCTYVGLFDHLSQTGSYKTVSLARMTFLASQPFNPRISVSTDYQVNLPIPPNPADANATDSLWDVGLWDVAVWDAEGAAKRTLQRWASIGRSGISGASQLQITSQGTAFPDAELVAISLIFEEGAIVV
jgi:hypothetical protein